MIATSQSRWQFEIDMSQLIITDKTVAGYDKDCFICIYDSIIVGEPYFKEPHENVLILNFDDVEYEIKDLKGQSAVPMSKEQAKELVDFLIRNKKNGVTTCRVHCTAGVSRSVAVKNFINMFFNTGNHKVINLLIDQYREERLKDYTNF